MFVILGPDNFLLQNGSNTKRKHPNPIIKNLIAGGYAKTRNLFIFPLF